jgi:cytochrome c biogenesis protein CcmG/thiol:disulfide interchange protein DsbE
MGRERRLRVVEYGFLIVAVALLAFGLVSRRSQAGHIAPIGERKAMPELVLDQLDGGSWRVVEHRGQVVLINYWATWCGPCLEETPGLVRLAREKSGLAVVGVSMDEGDRKKVRDFVGRFHVPYPVAFPEGMSQMSAGMVGLPTTILVDKSGRVAKTYVGAVRQKDFEADVTVADPCELAAEAVVSDLHEDVASLREYGREPDDLFAGLAVDEE